MYRKIVVPLDGSEQAEKVVPIAQTVLAPGGELILLRIVPLIPTALAQVSEGGPFGYGVEYTKEIEAGERAGSMDYLEDVGHRMVGASGGWRCEVEVAGSVADGIAEFAGREDADLIAMYTHDRKGLAKLLRGSIAEKVQRRAPIEVQVFKPWELTPEEEERLSGRIATLKERPAAGSQPVEAEAFTALASMLSDVGPFNGLPEEQLNQVASLVERAPVTAGEVLGKAGDVGDYLYIIMHGEAQLSVASSVGEITVRIAGPGESFPLSSLIGSGTLITSAKALTDMELLVIPRRQLTDLCSEDSDLGLRVYMSISELVAKRYAKTLEQLALGEERVPQDADSLTSI